MDLTPGTDPRDARVGWAMVGVQAVLILAIALAPTGAAWQVSPGVARVARWLQWVGMAVLAIGLVTLGRSLTAHPAPLERGELRTGGPYRLVRHPIYAGILALAAGASATGGSWVILGASIGLVALFMVKARWEEVRLRARYPGYDAYAARTPRFIPGWPFGADRRRRAR
ncbi:MAG: isoprenylcysteine carboxylmethyltransferase family protein [Acidimicrobiales bacterium]